MSLRSVICAHGHCRAGTRLALLIAGKETIKLQHSKTRYVHKLHLGVRDWCPHSFEHEVYFYLDIFNVFPTDNGDGMCIHYSLTSVRKNDYSDFNRSLSGEHLVMKA